MGIDPNDLNERQRAMIEQSDRSANKLDTLSELMEKAAPGRERKEHATVMAHVRKYKWPVLHADTRRRVHDLPPGWPDFTAIRGKKVLLIEMKVTGGKLSSEQMSCHVELAKWGTYVEISPNASAVIKALEAFYA
jgi:hypothetical protein